MSIANQPKVALRLSVLEDQFAVCKLEPDDEVPGWAVKSRLFSVTRTPGELSVVCPEQNVPRGVLFEGGWRALGLEGPLDFSLTGVLASIATPLAEADVSIFALSTYDTDYVLVKEELLRLSVNILLGAGHEVRTTEPIKDETFTIRAATTEDESFLWEMLAEAAQESTARNVMDNLGTARYVEGWGREGDLGFVAVSKGKQPIGAAWLRLLTNGNRGYGYVDDETPELAIAVHPDFRGTGVGTRLLTQLLQGAGNLYRAVCLSVRTDNPALHLYEKMDFEIVQDSEKTNRAKNSSSFTMRRDLH